MNYWKVITIAAAITAPQIADAATYIYAFTGITQDEQDITGSVTFDDASGTLFSSGPPFAFSQYASGSAVGQGLTGFGAFTLGARTFSVDGLDSLSAGQQSTTINPENGVDYVYGAVNDGIGQSFGFTGILPGGFLATPISYTNPLTWTNTDLTHPTAGGDSVGQYDFGDDFQGSFTVMAVSVSIAAVPEPATWALMALGFTGVGGALRRRRRRVTVRFTTA